MQALYPRFIPAPIPGKPDRIVRVEKQSEHQRLYPEDFAKFQYELNNPKDVFVAQASAEEERERCAMIAETFPRAGKIGPLIAAEIRGLGAAKNTLQPDYPADEMSDFGKPMKLSPTGSPAIDVPIPEPAVSTSKILNG